MKLLLAIESSCDETAVALWSHQGLITSLVASQIDLHRHYGGVVPEVASREHMVTLKPLIASAFQQTNLQAQDCTALAATAGPGLASSLLIGHTFAKGLAIGLGVPFISVNHLEGHLLSPFLNQAAYQQPDSIPRHLALIISGGHTLLVGVQSLGHYQILGQTRDDAAGEAFDKVARLLGLGYPGGPEIEQNAQNGQPDAFNFPRGLIHENHADFSFSGLKTSVRYTVEKMPPHLIAKHLPDLCASFQQAIIDVLIHKALHLAQKHHYQILSISGGVACNRTLRTALTRACQQAGLIAHFSPPEYATDNAAMIAYAAWQRHLTGQTHPLTTDISPRLPLATDQ